MTRPLPNGLSHHREVLAQLIERDRNHPSVIMWSIANEPATWVPESRPYWETLFADARAADPSRPLTVVECGDHTWPIHRIRRLRIW